MLYHLYMAYFRSKSWRRPTVQSQGMDMRQTVPAPVLPSNVKKFAIGASRAASVFSISCASIPPTMAQTGENSVFAVSDRDLCKHEKRRCQRRPHTRQAPESPFRAPASSHQQSKAKYWLLIAVLRHPRTQLATFRAVFGTPKALQEYVGSRRKAKAEY